MSAPSVGVQSTQARHACLHDKPAPALGTGRARFAVFGLGSAPEHRRQSRTHLARCGQCLAEYAIFGGRGRRDRVLAAVILIRHTAERAFCNSM